ncbi:MULTISPECIES: SDR family oxidoreductase [unclassified Ruegeria]|uniref:SDR family oxidoreductase n=1 Tax=unclassified Ruegeria TaxID=2625375 RepID=UPI0014897E75|nr:MULTISPECIES: SDR family oxidoreductase [unclassified Ruegeria]
MGATSTRRPNEARDVAATALFLAGSDARQITGHILPVDGGATSAFLSLRQ